MLRASTRDFADPHRVGFHAPGEVLTGTSYHQAVGTSYHQAAANSKPPPILDRFA